MRKNKNQVQQGDVIFVKVDRIPGTATKIKHKDSFILAYGEATGHTHLLDTPKGVDVFGEEETGLLFINNQLKKKLTVTHEEHKAIDLDEGIWKVGRIVESDSFERAVRRVAD